MDKGKLSFDGRVGDLGSKGACATISSISIENKGDEVSFADRCRDKFKGKKILDESVSKNGRGCLVYSARIESTNGI